VHLDHLPGTFFGPSTLVELLGHRARCQAKDVAYTILVDGEDEKFDLTYEELDRQARAIAAWLQSYDLVGQRALLLYPPGAEFIAAFFGCLYSGVVAVPVYPPRRNRSLLRIQTLADDADARVALTTDSVLQRVETLIDETPHLKQLKWLATCHVPEGIERQWQPPDVHGETLAFLQYTSGSTGTPKGVMLNHANLVHNSALIAHVFEHTRSGSGVFWLPSYHDMGLIGGILQPMYVGRPNVLMSPMSFLQKPYRWLSAITRFRGTTSGGPNFAYDLCVRKITPEQRKTLDLSSWRIAFNGAEPVRAETLQAFTETFEPCGFHPEAFYPCYGLAEATLIVSGGYAHDMPVMRAFDAAALSEGRAVEVETKTEGARVLVGSGRNMPDQQIVIANPHELTTCPADRIGEIWVRGPSIAQGYWRQPETTAATFQAYLKDTGEGPFLRTGDLGLLGDGELFVTGRIKDLLIIRGVNHYPQDIEYTVQQSHQRLRSDSGAAFSIDRDGKEELVVVQEIERGEHVELGGIFNTILQNVAAEHDLHPHAILLLKPTSIPKTSSGKVQRHACRDGYLEGSLAVVGQWCAADSRQTAPREEFSVKTAAVFDAKPGDGRTCDGAPRESRRTLAASKNGQRIAVRKRTIDLVVEEIGRVAGHRADNLSLDTPIVETGLDSLERMEILASLEDRYGGRFPEAILPELETTRQLAAAVEKYLGLEPRPRTVPAGKVEIPPAHYRFDQFPEYLQLRKNLDLLESSELGNPYFSVHEGITSDRTVIGGRELINFCSYNYLGMSGNPEVSKAAKEAIDRYGTSTTASRLVSGEKVIHGELERAVVRFLGTEACIAMVGGHSTNETVIGHLMGPGDLILHDGLAHNSIVQGSILSGARRRPFVHNDWQAADHVLEQVRHEYRRVLLVIEGAYSMDGDYPNLPEFIRVKQRHKALLMIDEAHSLGVLGPTGRGIGELYHVNRDDVDIWMCTFSKALGSCGGYISGCKALVEYLKYTAPGFVFAASIPPPAAGAALAALRLLEAHPEWPARARANAELFLSLARKYGMNTGNSQGTAVVPVILGNSVDCVRLSRAMFARGINVQPILHPAVEESAARLRFFITTLHGEEQIRFTVRAMAEELEKIDPKYLTKR
jgi:7-keto-8-aminopelargonate synthetase-like enzyme/acyl-CoA synthetase (AMP-forming)/AMP-acid ligase II/acyl carrier protein